MKRKEILIGGARASGRTHRAIMAIKDNPSAIFLVHSWQFAKELKEKYAPLCEIRGPTNPDSLRGLNKTVIKDHFLLEKEFIYDNK